MAWLPRWAIFQQKWEFYRLFETPLLILLDFRAKEDKWAICRRCLETDKKCFQDPDGCHCENVQVADPTQNDKLIGGSDCKDGFCYISKYIMHKGPSIYYYVSKISDFFDPAHIGC